MTKRCGWLILVAFAALLAACGEQDSSKTMIPAKQILKVTQNAYATLETYIQQQREMCQQRMSAHLDRLTRRIDKLQAKTAKLEGQSKSKLDGQIASLRGKRDVAYSKLEKMKSETDPAWEMLKGELDAALDCMERDYDKVLDALP